MPLWLLLTCLMEISVIFLCANVPEEIFAQFKDRLPDPWQKRATHYYEETARAQAGASAWRNGI